MEGSKILLHRSSGKKLAEYDTEVIFHETFDDDNQKITDGCLAASRQGQIL